MLNTGNSEYEIDLLDVEGENVLDNLKKRLDAIATESKIHYEIHVIDEGKMKGGNSEGAIRTNTFPYNVFENTVNQFLNQKTELNEKRKGLYEMLFGDQKNAPDKQYTKALFDNTARENGFTNDDIKKAEKKLMKSDVKTDIVSTNKNAQESSFLDGLVGAIGIGEDKNKKAVEVKEPEVKEPDVKEPDAKEPEVKEPEVKEPDVKEPDVKEPEAKEHEVKEPEVKEPEAKEHEVKEPEVKDVETDTTVEKTEDVTNEEKDDDDEIEELSKPKSKIIRVRVVINSRLVGMKKLR